MILRPSNPTSYCSTEDFLYVNHHVAISPRSRIPVTGVLASVELVRANREPIETASPTTTTYDVFTFNNDELGYSTLPDSKFDSIVGIIENLGGRVDMSSGYVNVVMENCFDELINMLPDIRYRLAHEIDGAIVPVIDIILEANEFVKLTSNRALCELKIEPERHFGAFRIDPIVSSGMSVFYDYQNNRFGLCDATD